MHDDTTLDHEDPEAGSTWMWGVSGAVITLAKVMTAPETPHIQVLPASGSS